MQDENHILAEAHILSDLKFLYRKQRRIQDMSTLAWLCPIRVILFVGPQSATLPVPVPFRNARSSKTVAMRGMPVDE